MQISRRVALMGATAAAVVAGVPGAVQADDQHLELLHAEWREAAAKFYKANRIADEAMGKVFQTCPCPLDDLSGYSSGVAIGADIKAWKARRAVAVERFGAGELQRRADAAHEVSSTAFNRFMQAPAQTPRGLHLKLMAGMPEDLWEERADLQYYENIMLRAIRADLERMAKPA